MLTLSRFHPGSAGSRVAEVARRAFAEKIGLRRKFYALTYTHTLFCRDIKICRDLRTFGETMGKKVLWRGGSVSWARNAGCRFTYKNDEWIAKIANAHLTKILLPILRSPKGRQLLPPWLEVGYKWDVFVSDVILHSVLDLHKECPKQ